MFNRGTNSGVSSPTLINVAFSGNSAANNAGGIYSNGQNGGVSSPSLTNVLFSGNAAGNNAGALFNDGRNSGSSTPTLTNVTIAGNEVGSQGGAMYNAEATPTLTNAIVWDNGATISNALFMNSSTMTIINSLVQWSGGSGSWVGGDYIDGGNNIDSDPLFVTPITDPAPTTTGDLRLLVGSPAIDTGDNSYVTALTDLDGNVRIFAGTVDMGVYEFGSVPTAVTVNSISVASGMGWHTVLMAVVLAGVSMWLPVRRNQNSKGANGTQG